MSRSYLDGRLVVGGGVLLGVEGEGVLSGGGHTELTAHYLSEPLGYLRNHTTNLKMVINRWNQFHQHVLGILWGYKISHWESDFKFSG